MSFWSSKSKKEALYSKHAQLGIEGTDYSQKLNTDLILLNAKKNQSKIIDAEKIERLVSSITQYLKTDNFAWLDADAKDLQRKMLISLIRETNTVIEDPTLIEEFGNNIDILLRPDNYARNQFFMWALLIISLTLLVTTLLILGFAAAPLISVTTAIVVALGGISFLSALGAYFIMNHQEKVADASPTKMILDSANDIHSLLIADRDRRVEEYSRRFNQTVFKMNHGLGIGMLGFNVNNFNF